MDVVRSDAEIERVMDWAHEGYVKGGRNKSKTYEQGILDVILWLRGSWDDAPDKE